MVAGYSKDSKDISKKLANILGKQTSVSVSNDEWMTRIVGVTKDVRKSICAVLGKVESTLNSKVLGDLSVDPDAPDAFIVGLRIPRQPEIKMYYPSRLYYIILPRWDTEIDGVKVEIARVLAIGGNQVISLRNFLRSWIDSGIGGSQVYNGEVDLVEISEAISRDVLYVIEESRNLNVNRSNRQGLYLSKVLLWPIDSQFKLDICPSCLLPKGCGIKCNTCSAHRMKAWS